MKKLWVLVTGLLLSVMLQVQVVLAESALQIGVDQYEVTDDGKIILYVNQNREKAFVPSIDESSIMIGKNTVTIENMQSLEASGEPITYLCLVDISGSMTSEGILQTKETLQKLVEAKGKNDNFCITTMGNDVRSSGFLSDQTKLAEAIGEIERIGTEDTNLYYSIVEALNVLKTDKAVHKKRCLLLFSDGEDDQKKGITQKEAEDEVKSSHIPVFTVMLPGKNLKDAEASAKILGSFARNSAGGEHYAPPVEDSYDYEDIPARLKTRLQTGFVVSGSLEEIKEVGDDTVYLGVTLSDGTQKAVDGITVPAGTILEAIEAIEEARKAADVKVTVINEKEKENVEETPQQEDDDRIKKVAVIAVGVFVLVLLAAVLILLTRKKAAEEEETREDYDGVGVEPVSYVPETTLAANGYSDTTASARAERVENRNASSRKKGKIQVTLFQVGPGKAVEHKFTIKDRVTIGRDKDCQLSLADDTALSGRHCSLLYRDDNVYVRDEESTNGTFVNGVPIVGEYRLECDDILLIGSFEYRIVWE